MEDNFEPLNFYNLEAIALPDMACSGELTWIALRTSYAHSSDRALKTFLLILLSFMSIYILGRDVFVMFILCRPKLLPKL